MLRIVIDGAGDTPPDWPEKYDFQVIPININFEERTFIQGVDLSNEDFYQLVDRSGVIPKTSQPTPHQFIEFYRRIAQPGDTILSLHVTSSLSGTFASAEMAAKELEGEFNVIPFDSANGSVGMAFMAREARLLERAGAAIDQVVERMKVLRETIEIVLTLDTLDYARMSGRVKTLQAALVSLLNVKPIVLLRDGVLNMADRVRTRRRALGHIVEYMKTHFGMKLVNAAVVHARDPSSGEALLEMVRERLNCKDLIMTELSIAVAANLGPGTVGIVAYPVLEG